jgi:hypothetical protein
LSRTTDVKAAALNMASIAAASFLGLSSRATFV